MQQAQRMQKDLQKKQDELGKMEFEGSSEWVTIVLTGNKEMVKFNIKKNALDEDDIEMLEDMIKIAYNEALKKVENAYDEKLGVYGKQLNGLI